MSTLNSSVIPLPKPKCRFINNLRNTKVYTFQLPKRCSTRCNSAGSNNGTGKMKDVLSGIVDNSVADLLNTQENIVLLYGLEKASQILEATTSEIVECQKDLSEARVRVERSLSGSMIKNEERSESVKAALISALTGGLAELPIAFTSNVDLALPLAITFVCCALFGVTFRYVIRRDLDDFHLKTGVCAAFGFVKGLATLDGGTPLELNTTSFLWHSTAGVVYVSQNLLVFLFAAAALDLCIKLKILSPFPIDRGTN